MARIALLLAAVFAALLGGCGSATNKTVSTPTSVVKAELAPTGTLRVAVFTGNPVIGSKDKASGELKGTTVILGRELAARAGVPVAFVEYTAVGKMVEDAKVGAWDIAVVAFDPARKSVLDFAPPHMVVDLTYLVARVVDSQRGGRNQACLACAGPRLCSSAQLKAATVVPAENEPAVFALLREGKVDAIAQNRFLLLGLAEQLPGSRVLEDRFSVAEMTIVLPKGRAGALSMWGCLWRRRRVGECGEGD